MLIWILFDFRFFEKQLFYLLTFQNVIFFNSEYYTANLRKQDTRLWFLWKDSWDFFTATLRLLSPSGFWKGLGAVDMDKSGLEMVVLRMMFVVVKTFLLYGPENFHSYDHWLAERYARQIHFCFLHQHFSILSAFNKLLSQEECVLKCTCWLSLLTLNCDLYIFT